MHRLQSAHASCTVVSAPAAAGSCAPYGGAALRRRRRTQLPSSASTLLARWHARWHTQCIFGHRARLACLHAAGRQPLAPLTSLSQLRASSGWPCSSWSFSSSSRSVLYTARKDCASGGTRQQQAARRQRRPAQWEVLCLHSAAQLQWAAPAPARLRNQQMAGAAPTAPHTSRLCVYSHLAFLAAGSATAAMLAATRELELNPLRSRPSDRRISM